MADVERSKRELESNVQRKEREIGEAVSRLEAEQGLVSKQQRMIKEIQGKYSFILLFYPLGAHHYTTCPPTFSKLLTPMNFVFTVFHKMFEQILLFQIIFSGLFIFLVMLRS